MAEQADNVGRLSVDYLAVATSTRNLTVDKEDEKAFEQFCDARVSHDTITSISVVFFVLHLYVYIMGIIYNKNWHFIGIVFIISQIVRNHLGFFLVYYKGREKKDPQSTFVQSIAPWFPYLMNFVAVFTAVNLGLYLIARVANGRCESLDQLHMWGCSSEIDSRALPQEIVVLLMFVPIIFSITFKAIWSSTVFVSWILVLALVSIAIGISGATQSIPALLIYIPISGALLYEIHRQNIILFLMAKRQQTLLDTNQRLSEEAHQELRFMIANMAHDLKTPLASFMNGVEILQSLVGELSGKGAVDLPGDEGSAPPVVPQQSPRTVALQKTMKENIANLFNVNMFMTMTVNRCIDYMKSSKGIKLEPRLETINLQEVLSMPLNCMRDLQTRLAISQKRIPESVSSHVITDQQWFQENIFCLVSNAVKYSSQGQITVSLSLALPTHPFLESAKERKSANKPSPERGVYRGSTPTNLITGHQEKYVFLDRLAPHSSKSSDTHDETADTPLGDKSGAGSAVGGVAAAEDIDLELGASRDSDKTSPGGKLKTKGSGLSPRDSPRRPHIGYRSISNKVAVDNDSGRKSAAGNSSGGGSVKAAKTETATAGSVLRQLSQDEEEEEVYLLVEVEDTGIGLSDEVRNTLFAPFKQAQRRAGGTGLGLYSLANRVDALCGYYGVCSRRDGQQGSIFWFAIPYRPDKTAQSSLRSTSVSTGRNSNRSSSGRNSAESSSGSSTKSKRRMSSGLSAAIATLNATDGEGPVGNTRVDTPRTTSVDTPAQSPARPPEKEPTEGRLRVLLVDDSLTILKMTSKLLQRHGHVVDQEVNGADALARLEARRREGGGGDSGQQASTHCYYDVMLIDLNMPVMDGLEATKRLRERERLLHAAAASSTTDSAEGGFGGVHQTVFAFSANSDRETMREAMEAGADDFICKPFSIQTFNEKCEGLMAAKRGENSGAD